MSITKTGPVQGPGINTPLLGTSLEKPQPALNTMSFNSSQQLCQTSHCGGQQVAPTFIAEPSESAQEKIQLAREMLVCLEADTHFYIEPANVPIAKILFVDAIDKLFRRHLDLNDITSTLQHVLELTSEAVLRPTTGRHREHRLLKALRGTS